MPICQKPSGCPDKPACGMGHDRCPWAVEKERKAREKEKQRCGEPKWLGDLGL